MFIRLYEAAKNIGDDEIISFSAQVLDVFEKKWCEWPHYLEKVMWNRAGNTD